MKNIANAKIFILKIVLWLISLIPKKNNLLLFGSWFGEKYSDNSKYLFEYMLDKDKYEIYWVTRNINILKQLESENKPVLYSNSLKCIFKQIRAKMMIASVDKMDFNPYFIGGTIFFNLGHGIPLKISGFDRGSIAFNQHLLLYSKFNRDVVISSSSLISEIFKTSWSMADEIVSLGLPRNDIFFNELRYPDNNIISTGFKKGRKAIVYMPTHREEGKILLPVVDLINLDIIQKYCEDHDYIFIIKKHFYHRFEKEDLSSYSRIFDITNLDVDSQVLLYETDILITDYSSCFFDYLLLDRPIIFYCFDNQDYEVNRGVYFKYEDISAGPKCITHFDLENELLNILLHKPDEYKEFRLRVKNMFFDTDNQKEVSPKIFDYINTNYLA